MGSNKTLEERVNIVYASAQGMLMEKGFVCQNPHPAISFHCQNPLPKNLYFYHLKYQNDVRMMLKRLPVVRVHCIVRQSPVIYLEGGG